MVVERNLGDEESRAQAASERVTSTAVLLPVPAHSQQGYHVLRTRPSTLHSPWRLWLIDLAGVNSRDQNLDTLTEPEDAVNSHQGILSI